MPGTAAWHSLVTQLHARLLFVTIIYSDVDVPLKTLPSASDGPRSQRDSDPATLTAHLPLLHFLRLHAMNNIQIQCVKVRRFEYPPTAHLIYKATVLKVGAGAGEGEGEGGVVNAWLHLWNATKFLSSLAATAKKKKQSFHTDDGIQFVFSAKF